MSLARHCVSSLKVVLSLAAIIGAGVAVYLAEQQRSVAELERQGARITRNADGVPLWFVAHGVTLSPRESRHISEWSKLNSFELTSGNITPGSLEPFDNLPELRYMELSFSEAGPDCLRRIGEIDSLERLDLRNCAWVDDRGLSELRTLRRLRRLDLARTGITDEGLARLAELPSSDRFVQ